MANVLSLVPRNCFKHSDIKIPVELDIHYHAAFTENEIVEACKGMEFLLLPADFPKITQPIMDQISSIRMIQIAGAGFGHVDIRAAAANTIPVCNSPVKNINTVAEFTVAQTLNLLRNTMFSDSEIKVGNYSDVRGNIFKCDIKEMSDIKIGLLGFGRIGRQVARIAGYLGSEIAYCDINRANKQIEKELKAVYLQFDHLFAMCDVVSIHLPLTETTKKVVGGRELDLMRPGSFLINTASGEIVDQEALAMALETGPIAGAAVDTVSPEPPPSNHPLLKLSDRARERLLITPHIAGITRASFKKMIEGALINIAQVSHGHDPENAVYRVVKTKTL